jgi:phthiodiolone/phenolphthiodiolone dimycocerosates ketoreductase
MFALPPYRGKWPEIWVAAHGPRMLRITGRYADAWVPFVLSRPTDYARALEAVRGAASDAGRDPMSIIPAINRAVVTGRNRDDVDETLDAVVVKTSALAAPSDTWARHGVQHPLGTDFSGMQDLVPQTIDEQTALSYTAKVPASLMRELIFNGTPNEVIDQIAEWRDHGLRYPLVLNASALNPHLRKTLAANAPFLKILRGLKRL